MPVSHVRPSVRSRSGVPWSRRVAGALNQALAGTLPYLADEDCVLVMDADSHLNLNWLQAATAALRRNPCAGAVCGVFLGEPGGGLIGQLQRNEYIRYARQVGRRRQVPVLSGTGTLFRVSSLRAVAAERGRRLPGPPGQYYSEESITEDDEITLALKSLGRQCLAAVGCQTTTELMPTWSALWTQRIRWQKGALNDLRRYGRRSSWPALPAEARTITCAGSLLPSGRSASRWPCPSPPRPTGPSTPGAAVIPPHRSTSLPGGMFMRSWPPPGPGTSSGPGT